MWKGLLDMVTFSCMMVLVLLGCSSKPVSPQKPWVPIYGDLVWVESANIETVYESVLKTVKGMELSMTKQEQDGLTGVVVAKTLGDKRVTIKLQAETVETTRVSIRVGFWADEKKARVIYSRIKENL